MGRSCVYNVARPVRHLDRLPIRLAKMRGTPNPKPSTLNLVTRFCREQRAARLSPLSPGFDEDATVVP